MSFEKYRSVTAGRQGQKRLFFQGVEYKKNYIMLNSVL